MASTACRAGRCLRQGQGAGPAGTGWRQAAREAASAAGAPVAGAPMCISLRARRVGSSWNRPTTPQRPTYDTAPATVVRNAPAFCVRWISMVPSSGSRLARSAPSSQLELTREGGQVIDQPGGLLGDRWRSTQMPSTGPQSGAGSNPTACCKLVRGGLRQLQSPDLFHRPTMTLELASRGRRPFRAGGPPAPDLHIDALPDDLLVLIPPDADIFAGNAIRRCQMAPGTQAPSHRHRPCGEPAFVGCATFV